jgi:hypothetical protein
LTPAFGDYRDNVLLELERRIYNNIKVEYKNNLFDYHSVIPGAFRKTGYSATEINQILETDFIKWAGIFGIDYQTNDSFDSEDPFTWNYAGTYSNLTTQTLFGSWRAIYKYFYDSEAPHLKPWEMLGFSDKPTWWEDEYGPAPYTSGNEILWDDIEAGVIRQGSRRGTNPPRLRQRDPSEVRRTHPSRRGRSTAPHRLSSLDSVRSSNRTCPPRGRWR